MTGFVHANYLKSHAAVGRVEAAVDTAQAIRRDFDGARTLATMLLASVASAMIVVADQVADSWAEGHLLAAWVLLWAIGFVVLAAFAQTATRFSARLLTALDAWSASVARTRADERFWQAAQHDPRVMAELQAALIRQEGAAAAAGPARLQDGCRATYARSRQGFVAYEPDVNKLHHAAPGAD